MANGSLLAGLATAVALTTGNVQAEKAPDFSALIDAGGAKVALIQEKTRNANNLLVAETQPILLAQATTETDGKVYVAEVIQVDGTKKTVKYFRDTEGAIIPPPVVDGKLVDGSIAPDHPLRAKNAQVKILVKYDKESQLKLALVSKDDILRKADKDLKEIISLEKKGETITKEQLLNGFYSVYIIKVALNHGGVKDILGGLESLGKIKMKMTDTEITQIKREAEIKANNIWKSVTGAVA